MNKNQNVGRPRRIIDSQGRLQCCMCRCWQGAEKYHLNSRNSSGRDSRCKSCDNLRRKESRKKQQRAALIASVKNQFQHWKKPSIGE
ncbi:hypothetical protein FIU95_18715 [Microbulbifer sp. THAF38]|nr:hypothetical protein FIU95_18715 [Microbulbifer sp. THAF38]